MSRNSWGCLILGIFVLMTYQRNHAWDSSLTLWKDVVDKSPRKPRGHLNLGQEYLLAKRIPEAMEQFAAVIRLIPAQNRPTSERIDLRSGAISNIAKIYVDEGEFRFAAELLESQPYLTAPMVINLSVAYMRQRQLDRAESLLRRELTNRGETDDTAVLIFNLGEVLRVTHRCQEAANYYYRAQRLYPDLPIPQCS